MIRIWLILVSLVLSVGLAQRGSVLVRPAVGTTPPPDPSAPPVVVWTDLVEEGDPQTVNGQQKILYDPVSGRIYQFGATNSSIYSGAVFFGAISGNTYTQNLLSSSGGGSGCTHYPNNGGGWNNGAGSPLQPWLSDRHPEFQTAIDTTRNDLCQWSGLACGNNGGDGTTHRDLWCMKLNTVTDTNVWRKVVSATQTSGIDFAGAMTYAAANDVFILHSGHSTGVAGGFPETWVLCPTQGAPLNAGHLAAGCVTPDVFTRVFDDNGTCQAPCTQGAYADILYHSTLNRVFLFYLGAGTAHVWVYHITEKTWTRLTPSNPPTNSGTDTVEQAVSLVTSGAWAGRFIFHRTCHNAFGGCNWVGTFMLDPFANDGQGAWTQLKTQGSGPGGLIFSMFVPSVGVNGGLAVYEPNGAAWWKAELQ